MRGFLKNSLKGLAFVLGLGVLLAAASFVMIPRDNTPDDWKHDASANGILGEPENTVDVIMFGDSELRSSVVPLQIWEQQGITSYCCSTNKQRLWYTYELFTQALSSQKPKIIVFETNNLVKSFALDDAVLHTAEMVVPVLKYHDRWKCLDFGDIGKTPEYTYTDPNKGYYYSDIIKAVQEEDTKASEKSEEYIPLMNRMYINKMLSVCKDNGIKVLFLSTPSTKNWNSAKHKAIERLAKSAGADYLDMNTITDKLGIDWSTDTRDQGDHLNYTGASKVTKYLADYLGGKGILPDHRNDPSYTSWNVALADFKSSL